MMENRVLQPHRVNNCQLKLYFMEIQLIDGRFSVEEAEQLITAIINLKIDFHQQKIKTIHQAEEDIKHSEKRILQLEQTLREAIGKLKENNRQFTNIQAHIELSLPPTIGQ